MEWIDKDGDVKDGQLRAQLVDVVEVSVYDEALAAPCTYCSAIYLLSSVLWRKPGTQSS